MITDAAVARWRLRTQHLVEPRVGSAEAAVRGLLAVQGEQPVPTAWAIGCRTAARDPTDLAGLIERGEVLRTHVLRPTWHYVHADDLVWLLELTAPRVQRLTAAQLRSVHGLDGAELERATVTVVETVAALDHPPGRRWPPNSRTAVGPSPGRR